MSIKVFIETFLLIFFYSPLFVFFKILVFVLKRGRGKARPEKKNYF